MTARAERITGVDRNVKARLVQFIRRNALQLAIIGVLILLEIFFLVKAPETFKHRAIYGALMKSIPYWGIIALPLTMVVIAGEMDLSFISTMGVGMVVFGWVFDWTHHLGLGLNERLIAGFAACLAAGFLVGLLNGVIVVWFGIPSLIATIGTQFLWRGAIDVATNGQGRSLVFARNTALRDSLVAKINGYWPMQMFWMVLVAVLVWILLNRHKFGAHVYLIGDNENSARLMGINVNRTRMLLFAIVGLSAALGGIIQSMDVWYFWPNVGEGYLLNTLAAVFLGGTSVFGGTGTILGTFVGCFIIGAIQPGIIASGWTAYLTKLIYGFIIVAFITINTFIRRRLE